MTDETKALREQLAGVVRERDGLRIANNLTSGHVAEMMARAEAAEKERDRLREALKGVIHVARTSMKKPSSVILAMENVARAALAASSGKHIAPCIGDPVCVCAASSGKAEACQYAGICFAKDVKDGWCSIHRPAAARPKKEESDHG